MSESGHQHTFLGVVNDHPPYALDVQMDFFPEAVNMFDAMMLNGRARRL